MFDCNILILFISAIKIIYSSIVPILILVFYLLKVTQGVCDTICYLLFNNSFFHLNVFCYKRIKTINIISTFAQVPPLDASTDLDYSGDSSGNRPRLSIVDPNTGEDKWEEILQTKFEQVSLYFCISQFICHLWTLELCVCLYLCFSLYLLVCFFIPLLIMKLNDFIQICDVFDGFILFCKHQCHKLLTFLFSMHNLCHQFPKASFGNPPPPKKTGLFCIFIYFAIKIWMKTCSAQMIWRNNEMKMRHCLESFALLASMS